MSSAHYGSGDRAGDARGGDDRRARRREERADERAAWLPFGLYPGRSNTRVVNAGSWVPQDRDGRFSTQVFERYQRSEMALGHF